MELNGIELRELGKEVTALKMSIDALTLRVTRNETEIATFQKWKEEHIVFSADSYARIMTALETQNARWLKIWQIAQPIITLGLLILVGLKRI